MTVHLSDADEMRIAYFCFCTVKAICFKFELGNYSYVVTISIFVVPYLLGSTQYISKVH